MTVEKQYTDLMVRMERLTASIEENNRNQERVFKTVYGDGNGSEGLVTIVDRLDQSHKRNKWAIRTALAATWSAILAYVFTKSK